MKHFLQFDAQIVYAEHCKRAAANRNSTAHVFERNLGLGGEHIEETLFLPRDHFHRETD